MRAASLMTGSALLATMVVGIALFADPDAKASAELIWTEQSGAESICEPTGPRGEWRCMDVVR